MKEIEVKVTATYCVDVSELDESFIDIEGFVRDEAIRMLKDDLSNGYNPDTYIIKKPDYECVEDNKNENNEE